MSEAYTENLPYEVLPVEGNISLRQLKPEEAPVLFGLVDENREYLREWLPWVDHTHTPDDSAKFIAEMIQKRKEATEYGYAICIDDEPVGHMSLMHVSDDKNLPEIGYWIASSASGQGNTTKAAQTLTDFGLHTLGLPKIIIMAKPENIASNKVAEKLGYKLQETAYSERLNEVVNIWAISPPK